ncbi:MAG: DEAD/DEAH box helicase family protein [Spirochaetales bacterium]|nr:DEAD/DEAH box helicase family protein [Leptospiraceae bacterium]MCP5481363.1 DEAD/DEAH box helicase family protein [Spirochaetales bacterium]MCP5486091.1 DEAD/DEAH box helicase family protein [Spirochaetales bacterium]
MSNQEVQQPILCSPYAEPHEHWHISLDRPPEKRQGRRPSIVFPPEDQAENWDTEPGVLERSEEYSRAFSLSLVNRIRRSVKEWRATGYPGATRMSKTLLEYWRHPDRENRLFFAQLEAAEVIVFLREARKDFVQGLEVPQDMAAPDGSFQRYACKMATGSGKSMLMAMLAAWSILNKVTDRGSKAHSDVVLIVCPNITIRDRLRELQPEYGSGSVYRKHDLVPPDLMPKLQQGKVIIRNWHVLDAQSARDSGARVVKRGIEVRRVEKIKIGEKNQTRRGTRYLTLETYAAQKARGDISVLSEKLKKNGKLDYASVETVDYVESAEAVVRRVLRDAPGKKNVLVFNDEAHHAYRIASNETSGDENDDEDESEAADDAGTPESALASVREATVWVQGLDRIHNQRGINFCLDLSATPYFLSRAGRDTGKPFPWTVSDFSLMDAIESGLVKIPQLALRDASGNDRPHYFRLWDYVLSQMTTAERGGKRGNPKPEAVLKYADPAIRMLAGEWETVRKDWQTRADDRPPVFIVVCKNTKIAKVIYEWIAEDTCPTGIPSLALESLRNPDGQTRTIRVDSKVIEQTDGLEGTQNDENRWMRFTLDTVGSEVWPRDPEGREVYPDGFEEVAEKLGRPKHPPGRDIRCIVSVGMLTEGWSCNTVTHIVGLRPFMSQLLCEQVVGRGLRRASYDLNEDDRFDEETAQIIGVPFEVVPLKARAGKPSVQKKINRLFPIPERKHLEIRFPRVERIVQHVQARLAVDWNTVPSLKLDPSKVPTSVDLKGLAINEEGRPSFLGPGEVREVSLAHYRSHGRLQQQEFALARQLAIQWTEGPDHDQIPRGVLFPQLLNIVKTYVKEKIQVPTSGDVLDAFISPYYSQLLENLTSALRPDVDAGEQPEIASYETNRPAGSTRDVYKQTRRPVFDLITKSHLNGIIAHTGSFEQQAAVALDKQPKVIAFAKNEGLGFEIPYQKDSEVKAYIPDFLVRVVTPSGGEINLILETKGPNWNDDVEAKTQAAVRWCQAVTNEGSYGKWVYILARSIDEVTAAVDKAATEDH